MITCPWCGTNYQSFQSNCSNCGGSLPLPIEKPSEIPEAQIAAPPPARGKYLATTPGGCCSPKDGESQASYSF